MGHLEKTVQVSSIQDKELRNILGSGFKMVTDLSVPQLAYFL
jgi:hypothetical protein